MVAMNSIPQQEVAKGRGHIEFLRASPTASLSLVAIKPSPVCPSGISTMLIEFFVSAGTVFTLNLTGLVMLYTIYVLRLPVGLASGYNYNNRGSAWVVSKMSIFPLQSA